MNISLGRRQQVKQPHPGVDTPGSPGGCADGLRVILRSLHAHSTFRAILPLPACESLLDVSVMQHEKSSHSIYIPKSMKFTQVAYTSQTMIGRQSTEPVPDRVQNLNSCSSFFKLGWGSANNEGSNVSEEIWEKCG